MSPNEIKILKAVRYWHLAPAYEGNPVDFLESAALNCFLHEYEGPAVSALRRAITHLRDCKYRGNQEYEALIAFDESGENGVKI